MKPTIKFDKIKLKKIIEDSYYSHQDIILISGLNSNYYHRILNKGECIEKTLLKIIDVLNTETIKNGFVYKRIQKLKIEDLSS